MYCLAFTTIVPHCIKLRNHSGGGCSECDESTFVESSTKCKQRSLLGGCLTFLHDKDECATCSLKTHYLESGACVERTIIDFCVEYRLNMNECLICDNDHFLADGKCDSARTIKDNCIEYITDDNKCKECDQEYYLNNGKCDTPRTKDSNCEVYSIDDDSCDQCIDGYFNSNGSCVSIKNIEGCLEYKSHTKCKICTKETLRSADSFTCGSILEEKKKTMNCNAHSNSIDSKDQYYPCDRCEQGFNLGTVNSRPACTPNEIPTGCSNPACTECDSPEFYADYYDITTNTQVCKPYIEEPSSSPASPTSLTSTTSSTSTSSLLCISSSGVLFPLWTMLIFRMLLMVN